MNTINPSNFQTTIPVEQRRHRRVAIPLKMCTDKEEALRERQINISQGGVCFTSPHKYEREDFILFHFWPTNDSSSDDKRFSIVGKIVWCKNGERDEEGRLYRYGAQFKFYDDPFSRQQRDTLLSVFNSYGS